MGEEMDLDVTIENHVGIVEIKRPLNMKTASVLSWVFPGMGHYYSGRTGKGILFTGLELAALAGVAITLLIWRPPVIDEPCLFDIETPFGRE